MQEYLTLVADGKLPINHAILYHLQDIFNLLPNLDANDLSSAMSATTSDQMLVVYLATLLRASIALHNLINNKIENQEAERKSEAGPEEKKKEKEEKEKKEKGKEADKDQKKKAAGK